MFVTVSIVHNLYSMAQIKVKNLYIHYYNHPTTKHFEIERVHTLNDFSTVAIDMMWQQPSLYFNPKVTRFNQRAIVTDTLVYMSKSNFRLI